ncbi:hypothetical protein LIER_26830 [Lithospermum erythrorhizon]|uniref:Reverse transcriptase domain-containing protein n=1 Tax=Lithospermum erythrorhizon TaxID=34254 RepID=A0AAV3RFM3_LITER
MCTDFTSLNIACPKDFYPLPCLARHVDGRAGHEVLDLMDPSRGQIGRNVDVYVDDMLVKIKVQADHLNNLRETFDQLWMSKLRINRQVFIRCDLMKVSRLHERGIEPNTDKMKAILDMQPPRMYRDIQKLTGCLAALSRFISKSSERNLPFFKNLRQTPSFLGMMTSGPLLSCVSQDIPKILVENKQFKVEDLVLRLYSVTHPKNKDKLRPKWEGSYRISLVLGPGTYELERMNFDAIPRTWHAFNLSKYYV